MPPASPAVHLPSTSAPPGAGGGRWHLRPFAATAAVSLGAAVAVTVAVLADDKYLAALRDPAAVAHAGDDLPYYTGWLTFAGTTLWFAAAAATLLASRALLARGRRRGALMLTGFAGLSAALGADDLFMIHDGLMSRLGVPEQVVMGTLALLAVAWALAFRRELLADPDLPILALSAVFFAHSLLSDVVGNLLLHEEATKFAATLCWAVWAWRQSLRAISVDRAVAAQGS